MYTFTPMTEEEINILTLMEEGIYEFEIINSVRRESKAGNSMAELMIKIWDKDNKERFIYDYLVFSSIPLNIKKVKHFCDSTNLVKEYNRGELPEDLIGLSGKVQIGIQDERLKPDGGKYPKKNIVIDYIKEEKNEIGKSKVNSFDDVIPF